MQFESIGTRRIECNKIESKMIHYLRFDEIFDVPLQSAWEILETTISSAENNVAVQLSSSVNGTLANGRIHHLSQCRLDGRIVKLRWLKVELLSCWVVEEVRIANAQRKVSRTFGFITTSGARNLSYSTLHDQGFPVFLWTLSYNLMYFSGLESNFAHSFSMFGHVYVNRSLIALAVSNPMSLGIGSFLSRMSCWI